MKKTNKIITAALGFMMLMPGLAKLGEPFKTFIYQHLDIIGFPLPEIMQYVVKFGEIGLGLGLFFIAFSSKQIDKRYLKPMFYLSNIAVIGMMIVAIYTHLHPDVPAEILPFEYKPPVMGISYILLASINMWMFSKSNK